MTDPIPTDGIPPLDPDLQTEAEARWGETPAWRESGRRTRRYGPSEWARIEAAGEANEEAFAGLLRSGERPNGEAAMELAEEARLHIDHWFYPCSKEMHAGLADLYDGDPRFKAYYDDREPGLAAFVAEAVRANARR